LPTLTMPPGSVTANIAAFLEITLTDTQTRLSELDIASGGQIDTTEMRSKIENMRSHLGLLKSKIRNAIASPSQAETIGEINGNSITLDQESL